MFRPTVATAAIGALLAAAGSSARAESSSGAEDEHGMSATLTLGGGIEGVAQLAVIDGRVDGNWQLRGGGNLAIGIGARLRLRDGDIVKSDWDDRRDAVTLLRYLEVTREVGSVALGAALGPLADVKLGRVFRGYTTAIDADVIHPGVNAAAAWSGGRVDAMVDDVLRPTMVGGAATVGLTSQWSGNLSLGLDVGGSPEAMAAFQADPLAQVELGATRWLGERDVGISVGGALVLSPGEGGALLADANFARQVGAALVKVGLEARTGTGAGAVAPFGPLFLVQRERDPMMMPELGTWLGGALSASVATPTIGEFSGELRRRADTGWQATSRLLVGAPEPVQVGSWVAVDRDDVAFAGELRVRWSERTLSRLEVTRSFARDENDVLRPRLALMAWFGTTAGW